MEPGSVLGCRMILNQPKIQAQLTLKTHHTHKLDKMDTMLPKEGHDKPRHKKKREAQQESLEETGVAFLFQEGGKQPT